MENYIGLKFGTIKDYHIKQIKTHKRYNTTNDYLLMLRMNNNINMQRELKQEFLEKGLIIGSIATVLEKDKQIDFTCNMAYDTEFLDLANNLITEFNNSNEKYFTEFVEYRLKEMQEEINKKEKSNENN